MYQILLHGVPSLIYDSPQDFNALDFKVTRVSSHWTWISCALGYHRPWRRGSGPKTLYQSFSSGCSTLSHPPSATLFNIVMIKWVAPKSLAHLCGRFIGTCCLSCNLQTTVRVWRDGQRTGDDVMHVRVRHCEHNPFPRVRSPLLVRTTCHPCYYWTRPRLMRCLCLRVTLIYHSARSQMALAIF